MVEGHAGRDGWSAESMRDERPILVRYGPALAPVDARDLSDMPTVLTAAIGVRERPSDASSDEYAGAASTERYGAWRPLLKQALVLWLATRLLLVVFTLAAAAFEAVHGNRQVLSSPGAMLELWRRFDTTAYLHIVEQGYVGLNQAAFFPLYPLLIAGPAHLFGAGSDLLVALLISNLGTLAAFLGIAKLAVDEGGDQRMARNAMIALAVYPMAFFLGAAYTEGPFIAAAVWCLWAMRRGRWTTAVGCALFAALLRPTGVILYAPLLFEFARQHAESLTGWWQSLRVTMRQNAPQTLTVLLASPLGIGLYSLYCAVHFGDLLGWMHSEGRFWGRPSMPIWQALHDTSVYIVSLRPLSSMQDKKLVDYLAILLVLIVTLALIRRQPVAFTLYLAGLLYLTLDSPFVISAGQHYAVYLSASRYMLPAIPVFLALGRWGLRSPRLALVALLGALALQAVFAIYFLQGGWVA